MYVCQGVRHRYHASAFVPCRRGGPVLQAGDPVDHVGREEVRVAVDEGDDFLEHHGVLVRVHTAQHGQHKVHSLLGFVLERQ